MDGAKGKQGSLISVFEVKYRRSINSSSLQVQNVGYTIP